MLYVNAWYSIMIDSQLMKRQNKLESKYKESYYLSVQVMVKQISWKLIWSFNFA